MELPVLLIVADTPEKRTHYKQLIRESGDAFHVDETDSHHAALQISENHPPDGILLELPPPDVSGLDVLERLRSRSQSPAIVVVAHADDSRLSTEALKRGADDWQVRDQLTSGSVRRAIRRSMHTRSIERQLQSQRDRLQLFLRIADQTSDALLVIDAADNRLVETNHATATQFGYRQSDLIGADYRGHALFENARAELGSLTAEDASVDQVRFECDVHCRDGHQVSVELNAKRVTIGSKSYVIVMMRDISARRALELHLRRQSLVDSLTGIDNRRAFDMRIKTEWARAARAMAPIALLMIDVDYFKAYNDSCGHVAGDDCLHTIAQTLQHIFRRAGDHLSRYGGEEFAGIISHSDLNGALRTASAALEAIRDLRLPHPASPVSPYVTISIGMALQMVESSQSPSMLVRRADDALYKAKNAGRNRIEIAV
jgi:diguanylate cyclase (GGDEF)-like protein/PAS domain S-box-containing protein